MKTNRSRSIVIMFAATSFCFLQHIAYAKDNVTKIRYGFETSVMGWEPQDHETTLGIASVKRTGDLAKDGNFSLALQVDLVGDDKSKRTGEAYTSFFKYPLEGIVPPLDMRGNILQAWVYASKGAQGDTENKNGIQLSVFDEKFEGYYGVWVTVVEEEWIPLTLVISDDESNHSYKHPNFNPENIHHVGINIGIDENSTANFNGMIYIDSINW